MSLQWLADEDIARIMESFERFNTTMYAPRNFLYINLDLGKTPRALCKGLKRSYDVSTKHNKALKDLSNVWQDKTSSKYCHYSIFLILR